MVNESEKELIKEYVKLWDNGNNAPKWAFQIPPAIPAIGSKMAKRIISFASCENIDREYASELVDIYNKKEFSHIVSRPRWPTDAQYFPNRHINPFDKGDQYVITWFALRNLVPQLSSDINEFSEQICTANPFKFTIRRKHKRGEDPKGIHTEASRQYLIKP